MSELTEFLLARIAADEAVALDCEDVFPADESFGLEYQHDHQARHDPARVLRECEAKRRIVERCGKYDPSWHSDMELADVAEVMEDTLYDLAAIYADHPDFDPAWS